MAGVVLGSNIVTERFTKIVQAVEEVNADCYSPDPVMLQTSGQHLKLANYQFKTYKRENFTVQWQASGMCCLQRPGRLVA